MIESLSNEPSELAVIIKNKTNDSALALRLLRKYFMRKKLSKEIYLGIVVIMINKTSQVKDRKQLVDLS